MQSKTKLTFEIKLRTFNTITKADRLQLTTFNTFETMNTETMKIKVQNELLNSFDYLNTESIPYTKCTDYFNAVIDRIAPILTAKAIKTILESAFHVRLWNLYCESCKYITDESKADFEKFTSEKIEVLDSSITKDLKKYMIEKENAQHGKLYRKHIKKYTMVKDNHSKRHRKEIIPQTVLKVTAYGKQMINAQKKSYSTISTFYSDLLQTAKESIVELSFLGLVNTASDIWELRSYCYKRVNQCLHSEKRVEMKKNYLYFKDEKPLPIYADCTGLKKAELKKLWKDITVIVFNALPKKSNRNKIIQCFVYSFYHNLPQKQTSELLNCTVRTVQKYNKIIIDSIKHNRKALESIAELKKA